MRKTVTISFSCRPSTYEKISNLKAAIELERMEKVNLSSLLDRLINLGFAYREMHRAEMPKQEAPKKKELLQYEENII